MTENADREGRPVGRRVILGLGGPTGAWYTRRPDM
ncbi:hypothetical protein M2156_008911 [Streptomyces sp. SAI-149]|nr:hypothetical protein [Streptomyces sp. SAI-149]